jgi:hypothetical protein
MEFTSNRKLKPLPEVLLRAHGGVASSMFGESSGPQPSRVLKSLPCGLVFRVVDVHLH